jgi:hypothetical protein
MPTFRVSSRAHGSVDVEAPNWLGALGLALAKMKVRDPLDRIAAETLPNGTILARDVRTGTAFVVVPLDSGEDTGDEASEELLIDIDAAPEPSPATFADEIREIGRARTQRDAVATALDAAMARTPAEGGSVLLRRGDELQFVDSRGPGQATLATLRIPADAGVAGFCVARGAAVALNDAYDDARFFSDVDKLTGVRTRSLLCVPLVHAGRALGCIELVNAPEGFGSDSLDRVRLLAVALAARLANVP